MSDGEQAIAGWYTDPDNPELLRYWDGQQWTSCQAGWMADPENPDMLRYWDGQNWGDVRIRPGKKTVEKSSFFSLLSPVTPTTAEANIIYLDPDEVLHSVRQGKRSDIFLMFGLVACYGGAFLFAGLISIIVVLSSGDLAARFWILAFIVGLTVTSMLRITRKLRKFLRRRHRSRTRDKGAFLCSVEEAQAVPDGALCTVSGVVSSKQGFPAFGEPDCVYYTYFTPSRNNNKSIEVNSSEGFYLGEGRARVWCAGESISAAALSSIWASLSEPVWAVFVGNEVAVTGLISTRPNGVCVLSGPLDIGFPIAAYTKDGTRHSSANDAQRASYSGSGLMGPARVEIINGYLAPT